MVIDPGIYYPAITPFTDDNDVDHGAFTELLEFGLDGGVHGMFVLGSAGQGPVMGRDQRKAALETAVETVDGSVPIIAHVGAADADRTIELARHAEDVGVDMLALLPPYYYTDHSEYEIRSHFARVAEAVDLDLLIYNNPKYAGIDITPERVASLVEEVPSVRGIKAAFDPPSTLVRLVDVTPDSFAVFAGMIDTLLPLAYHGVHGSVNPPLSVFPEVSVDFWDAIQDERFDDAVDLQRTIFDVQDVISRYVDPYGRGIYVELLRLRGVEVERYPKWDTPPVTDADRNQLRSDLASIGVEPSLVA